MLGRGVAASDAERIGTEIAPGLIAGQIDRTTLLGSSFAAESVEHGAVIVDLLEAQHTSELGAMFLDGARRAAAIEHPAAVRLLGSGTTAAGEAYVVRPSFEGETARELIARRPARIPPVEALRLVGDLLDLLAAAHERGLVHGALTSSDVFIAEDGSVSLLGLGWCEVRERIAERLGTLPVSVGFAAPERITQPKRRADQAADVWSAGAVLFALLTGELPYEGQSDEARLASAIERPPRTLTELFGEAPIVLARLVDTALDPDAVRRYTPARMRTAVRDSSQLPELFLLRDLRSHQAPSPASGPRRSPSAELAVAHALTQAVPVVTQSTVPPSGVRDPSHPDTVAIEYRTAETIPAPPPVDRGVADTVPAMPRVESPAPSARRRLMADVLMGEATACDADVRVLGELFQRFERVLDVPIGDPDRAAALDELWLGASAALGASTGGFVWNVAPWGFRAGPHTVWEPAAHHACVPHRLFRDGFRSFGLIHGVTLDELRRFVEILAIDDDVIASEDDRVTLLADSALEHIVFRAIEVDGGEPADWRESAARARRQIVAVASFDTSAQLEESWQESHKLRDRGWLEPAAPESSLPGQPITSLADDMLTPDRLARAANAALSIARQAGAREAVSRHLDPHANPPTSASDPHSDPPHEAAAAMAAIAELVAAVGRQGASGAGINELASRAEQELRRACAATGKPPIYSFTRDAVYVGRHVLPAARKSWHTLERLAELMTRLGVLELVTHAPSSSGELLSLATALTSPAGKIERLGRHRFGQLELVRGEPRIDDLARMSEGRRLLNVYASACTTMREQYAALGRGELPPARGVRRAAQQLASEQRSATWLGLTTLAATHKGDAGRAVQTAIVALTVARSLTRDPKLCARIACAALLADAGRPLLTALAGRSPDIDPSLEAHVPAASAMVCLASGASDNAASSGTIAFESGWLERTALLGPLVHPTASTVAELVRLSRRYVEGLAPRAGAERLTPAEALRRVVADSDADAGLRATFAQVLGALPPGSVIELETGEWAVVACPSRTGGTLRPVVRVVTDRQGLAQPKPIELDLGTAPSGVAVIGSVLPSHARFNVAQTFFGSL
jgi:serine/threonine protein kinase